MDKVFSKKGNLEWMKSKCIKSSQKAHNLIKKILLKIFVIILRNILQNSLHNKLLCKNMETMRI